MLGLVVLELELAIELAMALVLVLVLAFDHSAFVVLDLVVDLVEMDWQSFEHCWHSSLLDVDSLEVILGSCV